MVFAFVTPRRCPARKVTEIQTALRSSEHNHTHHRLSCFSLPTGQKQPKWSAFLRFFRADLPFHGCLTKTLLPSGFPAFSSTLDNYDELHGILEEVLDMITELPDIPAVADTPRAYTFAKLKMMDMLAVVSLTATFTVLADENCK